MVLFNIVENEDNMSVNYGQIDTDQYKFCCHIFNHNRLHEKFEIILIAEDNK